VFARQFRDELNRFAEDVIALDAPGMDQRLTKWCAAALGSHLLDGLCAWLDDGDSALDRVYEVMQTCGLLAMIDAWGDPHPPEWIEA
jgi:hypothetical protein